MRKIALLTILISGCATLEPAPRHVQYGIHADVNPPGFYGVDSETHERVYRAFDDPFMKAGQALSAPDYQAFQRYIDYLKREAEKRCK
jgi:hypothetical protein